jgi:hypothetical protein
MSLLEQDIKSIVDGIIAPEPILQLRRSWSPDTYYLQIRDRPTFSVCVPGLSDYVEHATNVVFTKQGIEVKTPPIFQYTDSISRSIAYDIENLVEQKIPNRHRRSDPLLTWLSTNIFTYVKSNIKFRDEIYSVWKWYKSGSFTKDDLSNAVELIRLIAKKHGAPV